MPNVISTHIANFKLESTLSDYTQQSFTMAVSSASAGLMMVFEALDLRNCEVLVSPLSWAGSLWFFPLLGIKPLYVDVCAQRLTIDPHLIKNSITARTKAVLSTDIFGNPADLIAIKSICTEHGLALISDSAQALGSKLNGQQSGYYADATIFSFGTGKLVDVGEGGAICTNDKGLTEKLLERYGHPDVQFVEWGEIRNPFAGNFRMNPQIAHRLYQLFANATEDIEKSAVDLKNKLECAGICHWQPNDCPNFFRMIVSPAEVEVLAKQSRLITNSVPYQQLLYQTTHPWFGSTKRCLVAESVIKYYSSITFLTADQQSC